MKLKSKNRMIFICLLFVSVFISGNTSAVTLTVQNGTSTLNTTVDISITVDDPSEIAGAAFTVNYDTTALELSSVDSSFFDSFTRGNEISGTGTMLSGVSAEAGKSNQTIFILRFYVKNTAQGDYIVSIAQSILNNTNAGYSSGGEYIPMLIGLDATKDLSDPDAYPMLSSTVNPGIISIDRDNDGLSDVKEGTYSTDINKADTDSDGMPDGWEVQYELNPLVKDSDVDTDGDGHTNLAEYNAGTNPNDKPPVSVAGVDQTVTDGWTVNLNGSGSYDPDNNIASYHWSQTSGASVTLLNSDTLSASFIAPVADEEGKALIFQLTVTDSSGLQSSDTCTVTVIPASQALVLELTDNWNLISIYKQPSECIVNKVLCSIKGKYQSVWAYKNNKWYVNDPENPLFSDLEDMKPGIGYWVKMTEGATICFGGVESTESIELVSGWNLVGFNSSISQSTAETIESILENVISVWAYKDNKWYVYDPANPIFSDLEKMDPGFGYWIKTKQACTWSLH